MVAPTLRLFNSLSEQGLGGACELAAAKASFTSRRLSVSVLTNLFG